ncbi:DUF2169 domain-containing protein [Yoonia sp. R2331]|uniref:DUF2169 family type VI secretion system accessory protein n=1 Tax=Yoonia sp. R2331 TaxID=3237238 RepID=UPI0034E3E9C5
MHLSTLLPLGTIFFKHWHTDDSEVGVAVAKAQFEIREDGTLKSVKPGPELEMSDVFAAEVATSRLLMEQEIAPAKVATDLTMNAVAHAPGGKPAQDWEVSVNIPDRLHYACRVRGPTLWSRGVMGWSLSDPEPVSQVPLTYDLAYGGPAQGDPDAKTPDIYDLNPAGQGYATKESLEGKQSFAAAQIGNIAEFMIKDPLALLTVHGFGPVAKAWLPRRVHAGTFDEDWESTRHPRMPEDYDLRFWNAAPHALQIEPMLEGTETIHLDGMTEGGGRRSLTLPGVKLMLAAEGENVSKNHTMKLDTLHIDVADPDPAQHRVTLVWRTLVTGPERFTSGQLQSVKIG